MRVKGVMVMAGLFTALTQILGACGQDEAPPQRVKADPPPKPPNCPDSPELANLKLSDGSLANVRIISFLNTKLYFPEDWVKYHYLDKLVRFQGMPQKTLLEAFSPEIHSDECAGVVHVFNPDQEIPIMTVWTLERGHAPISHVSAATTISMLHFAANQHPQSRGLRAAGNGGFYDALMYPNSDIILFLTTTQNYEKKTVDSRSVKDLVDWLSTPPSQRDNRKVFTLQVEAMGISTL